MDTQKNYCSKHTSSKTVTNIVPCFLFHYTEKRKTTLLENTQKLWMYTHTLMPQNISNTLTWFLHSRWKGIVHRLCLDDHTLTQIQPLGHWSTILCFALTGLSPSTPITGNTHLPSVCLSSTLWCLPTVGLGVVWHNEAGHLFTRQHLWVSAVGPPLPAARSPEEAIRGWGVGAASDRHGTRQINLETGAP